MLNLIYKINLWARYNIIVLILSLFTAFFIIGSHVINPKNITWIQGDSKTAYLGWAFYRSSSKLEFPLAWTERLGYPLGISIGYLDSIPIIAILLRPISGLLSEPFQYLGIYIYVCFILQGYYGFKIAGSIFTDNYFSKYIATIFFITAPAFLFRIQDHLALSSHWLILAAIYFLMKEARGQKLYSFICPFYAIITLSSAINPYLSLIVSIISVAAIIKAFVHAVINGRDFIIIIVSYFILAVLTFWVIGFITSGDKALYTASGYGWHSFNLLSPLDPLIGGLFYHNLPQIYSGQHEGYAYLGMGLILIFSVISMHFILSLRKNPCSIDLKLACPYLFIILCSTLLACSNIITIGSIVLIDIPIPNYIRSVLEMFRSSGRLFWPSYYLIFIFIFVSLKPYPVRYKNLLLSIALFVQLLDLWPLFNVVRNARSQSNQASLTNPIWRQLNKDSKHLAILPPWQCDWSLSPGGEQGYWTFGNIAIDQHMTLNSYLAGRKGSDELYYHCKKSVESFLNRSYDSNTKYVISYPLLLEIEGAYSPDMKCMIADGYYLCGSNLRANELELAPDYNLNEWITFGSSDSQNRSDNYLGRGWTTAESWGRWTDGATANIILHLKSDQHPKFIEFEYKESITFQNYSKKFDVMVNGKLLKYVLSSKKADLSRLKFEIPKNLLVNDKHIVISFIIDNPLSFKELKVGTDSRQLGLGIAKLRVGQ